MQNTKSNDPRAEKFMELMESQGIRFIDMASPTIEVTIGKQLEHRSGEKNVRHRNYAFIDSQNLNLAIRAQGWRLDFKRFRIYLAEKYQVRKAFLFLGFLPENQQMYDKLQEDGYIVVFKPTIKHRDGEIKGNCDAELVLHAMIEYKNYHQAVIVTGDGDFYCLVDYLYKKKKLLRLLVPNVNKYSKLLKPFAPNAIDFMNNLKKKLALKLKEKSVSKRKFKLKKESQLHEDETS